MPHLRRIGRDAPLTERRREFLLLILLLIALGAFFIGLAAGRGATRHSRQTSAAKADAALGGAPVQAQVGLGALWILICQRGCQHPRSAGQLVKVDLRSGRIVRRFAVANPSVFAIAAGSLWIADFWTGRVRRVDPGTGDTTGAVTLGLPEPSRFGDHRFLPSAISAGNGVVWVGTARGWLAEIAARPGRLVAMVRAPAQATGQLAAGARGVWVAEASLGLGFVTRAGRSLAVHALPYGRHRRLAVVSLVLGGGHVWGYGVLVRPSSGGLVLTSSAAVAILDSRTGALEHEAYLSAGPNQIAYANEVLLVANLRAGRVLRVDVGGGIRALRRVHPGGELLAVSPDAAWAMTRSGALRRIPLAGA